MKTNELLELLDKTIKKQEKRTYINSPEDAPKGAIVKRGARGGLYYGGHPATRSLDFNEQSKPLTNNDIFLKVLKWSSRITQDPSNINPDISSGRDYKGLKADKFNSLYIQKLQQLDFKGSQYAAYTEHGYTSTITEMIHPGGLVVTLDLVTYNNAAENSQNRFSLSLSRSSVKPELFNMDKYYKKHGYIKQHTYD